MGAVIIIIINTCTITLANFWSLFFFSIAATMPPGLALLPGSGDGEISSQSGLGMSRLAQMRACSTLLSSSQINTCLTVQRCHCQSKRTSSSSGISLSSFVGFRKGLRTDGNHGCTAGTKDASSVSRKTIIPALLSHQRAHHARHIWRQQATYFHQQSAPRAARHTGAGRHPPLSTKSSMHCLQATSLAVRAAPGNR